MRRERKVITDKHRQQLTKKLPQIYATIIPERTTKPVVSLHTLLAHAKNAVQCNYGTGSQYISGQGYALGEAEVYELLDIDGRGQTWHLKWRIEDGTLPDDLPWK